MIFYTANQDEPFYPKAALSEIAGQEVRLAHDERGFRVVLADGSDSEEAWASYSADGQPSAATVAAWRPAPPSNPPANPIATIRTGYAESQAERAAKVELLKSTAAYAIGAKIGADLAAADPPGNADELAAIKAEAKRQASILGGDFFDAYFPQIGAYREGGGPKFLADVVADATTDFLNWATPSGGITLPDGTVVLASGGTVEDLFVYFLTPPA